MILTVSRSANGNGRAAQFHPYYDIHFTVVTYRLVAGIAVTLLALCGVPFLAPRGPAPISPFEVYAGALPGQPKSSVIDAGFSCAFGDYCMTVSSTGPFEIIEVLVQDGAVSRLTASFREGNLLSGDLILWWGQPCRRVYGSTVDLWWPDLNVTATGRASPTGSRYFSAIRRISVHQEALQGIYDAGRAERCGTDQTASTPE